jgi:hypothetical protein
MSAFLLTVWHLDKTKKRGNIVFAVGCSRAKSFDILSLDGRDSEAPCLGNDLQVERFDQVDPFQALAIGPEQEIQSMRRYEGRNVEGWDDRPGWHMVARSHMEQNIPCFPTRVVDMLPPMWAIALWYAV